MPATIQKAEVPELPRILYEFAEAFGDYRQAGIYNQTQILGQLRALYPDGIRIEVRDRGDHHGS